MSFHACTGLPWGLLTLYKVGSIVEDGVSLLILWNKAYSNMLNNSRERSSVCRAAHRAVSLTSYKPFGFSSYLTTNIINCYSHSRMSRPAGISLLIPFRCLQNSRKCPKTFQNPRACPLIPFLLSFITSSLVRLIQVVKPTIAEANLTDRGLC